MTEFSLGAGITFSRKEDECPWCGTVSSSIRGPVDCTNNDFDEYYCGLCEKTFPTEDNIHFVPLMSLIWTGIINER